MMDILASLQLTAYINNTTTTNFIRQKQKQSNRIKIIKLKLLLTGCQRANWPSMMAAYREKCIINNYSSHIVFSHIPILNLVKSELAPFGPPTSKTPS